MELIRIIFANNTFINCKVGSVQQKGRLDNLHKYWIDNKNPEIEILITQIKQLKSENKALIKRLLSIP